MLEEKDVPLAKFRDQFTVALAPSYVAHTLLVESSIPLLKRTWYSYDDTGELIEFSEGYYYTEMQQYIVDYDV
ncbi:UTRA domain-containing protein [Paenibacillus silviterrae]|uniref:UTRA domain-containing protein n=1 Tax=Paenibacillus silviterrae TaxID=3242194 RepID=UPI00254358DA|nr:UTRA domain-containing protein [Paenibacillus chinjuensis]